MWTAIATPERKRNSARPENERYGMGWDVYPTPVSDTSLTSCWLANSLVHFLKFAFICVFFEISVAYGAVVFLP